MEEIEFIDIKFHDQLKEEWSEFIHTHHSRSHSSFYNSLIGTFPRRTVEAYRREKLEGVPLRYNQPAEFSTLEEMWDYFLPIQKED